MSMHNIKEAERVKGYSVVAVGDLSPSSFLTISSAKSVKVDMTTFSMDGVYPDGCSSPQFVADVVQPLVCASSSSLTTPLSRALLTWSSTSTGALDNESCNNNNNVDISILRCLLDNLVSSNPSFTLCFGIFSASSIDDDRIGWKWNQWSKKHRHHPASPNRGSSSRNTTPPTSARNNDNGPCSSSTNSASGLSAMLLFMAPDMTTREFDSFRPFSVEGESVLGLFPVKKSSSSPSSSTAQSRIAEPPRSYSPLTDVREVLKQFQAVVSFCNSNRRQQNQESGCDDQLVVVDILASAVQPSQQQHETDAPIDTMFRVRYIHCLSSGTVKRLVQAPSLGSPAAQQLNIASEVFGGNCRTSCCFLHQASSASSVDDVKKDYQLLQVARNVVNYASSSNARRILSSKRFNPEALFSYLGVKLSSHHSILAAQVALSSASSPSSQQQTAHHRRISSSSSPPLSGRGGGASNQQLSSADSPTTGTSPAPPLLAFGSAIVSSNSSNSDSELVAKLRRELLALNDLVVELRSRALRSEDVLKDERVRIQELQDENEWLRRELGQHLQQQHQQQEQVLRHQLHVGINPQRESNSSTKQERDPKVDVSNSPRGNVNKSAAAVFVRSATSGGTSSSAGSSNINKKPTTAAAIRTPSPQVKTPGGLSSIRNKPLLHHQRPSSSSSASDNKINNNNNNNNNNVSSTPRAIVNALDKAVRRASPSVSLSTAQSPALSNSRRSEPPWVARRAVENGHFTASTTAQRREQRNTNSSLTVDQRQQQQTLRVVTSLHRPKLVTAAREHILDDDGMEGFQRTRMIRHNEWEDPQELM